MFPISNEQIKFNPLLSNTLAVSLSIFLLQSSLILAQNPPNIPVVFETQVLPSKVEECNKSVASKEGDFSINLIMGEIWSLQNGSKEEQETLKKRNFNLGGGLVFYSRTECSEELNKLAIKALLSDPFVNWLIKNNKLGNKEVHISLGDTNGFAALNNGVDPKNDAGFLIILINIEKLLENNVNILMLHNELWETYIKSKLQEENKTKTEIHNFYSKVQIHTWVISSFLTDYRQQIRGKELTPSIYQRVLKKYGVLGKDGKLTIPQNIPPESLLKLMQEEIDQMNNYEIAKILNERHNLLQFFKAYTDEQNFEGSFDKQEVEKFISDFERFMDFGLRIEHKVKLIIYETQENGKIFYRIKFVGKSGNLTSNQKENIYEAHQRLISK